MEEGGFSHTGPPCAVPRREPPRCGLDPRRVLRDDEPALADSSGKLRVRGRIVAFDPATEHGDGRPGRFERSAVRLAVDATRHAAHDDEARCRELPPEEPRDLRSVRRTCTRADDRYRWQAEQLGACSSPDEQAGRRVVELSQQLGVRAVGSTDESQPPLGERRLEGTLVEAAPETSEAALARLLDDVSTGLGGEGRERDVAHREPNSVGER